LDYFFFWIQLGQGISNFFCVEGVFKDEKTLLIPLAGLVIGYLPVRPFAGVPRKRFI